jgi:type IV secretory pathway VirJ component
MKSGWCSTMSKRIAICIALGVLAFPARAQTPSSRNAEDDVSQLPLHAVSPKSPSPVALAIMLSGDGGWAGIDRRIADDLARGGVAVVGLDSRSYLMKARTPDEVAADIARTIRHYTLGWSVRRVALIGYSRGADLTPFVANRLPAALRGEIALIALLGPAERANFQFHWADLLSETSKPSDTPILPELERLRGMPVLCVYGKDEKESLCRLADTTAVRVDRRPGRHHFDGDYDAIATEILRLMPPLDPIGR